MSISYYSDILVVFTGNITTLDASNASIHHDKETYNPIALEPQFVQVDCNPNSTIAHDIINIVHEPQNANIKIHLRLDEKRRCKQPQLLGRLSGPFVSKLSWKKQLQKENLDGRETEVLTGMYTVPQAGRYFLEILVLMCEELPFETYDGHTCLENPDLNRLTIEGAVIDITIQQQNSTMIGYWYNDQDTVKHEPLYTRYQPQTCRYKWESISDEDKLKWAPASQWKAHCNKATNLTRFDPYKFQFTYKNVTLDSMKERFQDEGMANSSKVCFVGASHAQVLTETSTRLLNDTLLSFEQVRVKFAHQLNKDVAQDIMNLNCSKAVIGFGQWDAGWPNRHMTKFPDYEHDLLEIVKMFHELLHEADKTIDVFFRSTHCSYNPIGDKIGSCPASDWRNPLVIDMYNLITERTCKLYNVTFIDTNDICLLFGTVLWIGVITEISVLSQRPCTLWTKFLKEWKMNDKKLLYLEMDSSIWEQNSKEEVV